MTTSNVPCNNHEVETRSQKSRESLSYSRCRSVASLVVEVESIVLSSLRRRAVEVILVATYQYPLRRVFSSITPSSAQVSLPRCNLRRQKPPLKVQRSPFPNPTFRRTRGHLELHSGSKHLVRSPSHLLPSYSWLCLARCAGICSCQRSVYGDRLLVDVNPMSRLCAGGTSLWY